jgi:hypothetical protein
MPAMEGWAFGKRRFDDLNEVMWLLSCTSYFRGREKRLFCLKYVSFSFKLLAGHGGALLWFQHSRG